MQKYVYHLVLCLGLLSSLPAWGQWLVFDEQNSLQSALQWIEESAQWAQSIAEQVKQTEAQYNIIWRQIEQTETMVRNLQRIPSGMNLLDTVRGWSGQLSGLLSTARMMSYDLNTCTEQFTRLYQQVGTMTQTGEVMALRQRLLAGRLESSKMTMQVTAIQENLSATSGRLMQLLDGGWTAKGNLDVQQVQVMQQGLTQHVLQAQTAIQAAHARNTAQAQAEEAALEGAQLETAQRVMSLELQPFEPQGELPKASW